MATITVRVSDQEKAWLQVMADFYGVTLSELVKKYSMDDLEDEYDRLKGQVARKLWLDDHQQTVSMQQIMTEFD